MDLMWFLLLAHLLGDYGLQSDWMADHKGASIAVLAWHVTLYTVTIGITLAIYGSVTHAFDFWRLVVAAVLLGLFLTHFVQDFLKSRYFRSRQAYYFDQILHFTALFFIRWLVIK